jgi:hypothetical protein
MVDLSHPVRGVGRVGGAEAAHRPVRPALGDDPVRDVGEVFDLIGRAMVGPDAEGGSRAARVPGHDRVATGREEARGLPRALAFGGAPVARHGQDGGNLSPFRQRLGKPTSRAMRKPSRIGT